MPAYPKELNDKNVLIVEDFEGSCELPAGTRKIDPAYYEALSDRAEEIGRALIPAMQTEIIAENGQTILRYKCTILHEVHKFWKEKIV